jgi:hypothetical protein
VDNEILREIASFAPKSRSATPHGPRASWRQRSVSNTATYRLSRVGMGGMWFGLGYWSECECVR